MAQNDILLLDALLQDWSRNHPDLNPGECFETFVIHHILKNRDLSLDELELGWVDGKDDCGIDGLFVFIDGRLAIDPDFVPTFSSEPLVEVVIFSCRKEPTFRQEVPKTLLAFLPTILDLTWEVAPFPINEDILQIRDVLVQNYKLLAHRFPRMNITIRYASRGTSSPLPINITEVAIKLEQTIARQFSQAQCHFYFNGASELLDAARRTRDRALHLTFMDNYISRSAGGENTNFVILCRISDYLKFISDETGELRRYLFESNIRDVLSGSKINADIATTLAGQSDPERLDFWWLNNGITILASRAAVAGRNLIVENPQIVNGLQTSETIYSSSKVHAHLLSDERCVLVKLFISSDPDIQAKIIKATNYQSTVDLSALRAMDKIQRDIEEHLFQQGWFYDRRRGFHANQGRPADRIITMRFLGAAVRTLALLQASSSEKTKWARQEETYRRVFNASWHLDVYISCIEIFKEVDRCLINKSEIRAKNRRRPIVPYLAILWVWDQLGRTHYSASDLAEFKGQCNLEGVDLLGRFISLVEPAVPTRKDVTSPTLLRKSSFLQTLRECWESSRAPALSDVGIVANETCDPLGDIPPEHTTSDSIPQTQTTALKAPSD